MRLREREMPLDPQIERELEALDRALVGEPVDSDFEGVAELARELRAERPAPPAEVEAALDELAASGFPPRSADRLGRAAHRFSEAWRPVRERGTRQLLPALGAASLFLVVIGIGISQSGVFDGDDGGQRALTAPVQPEQPTGVEKGAVPDVGGVQSGGEGAARTLNRRDALGATKANRGPSFVPPARRKIAQNVDLSLSTAPGDFRDAADGVLDVVRDHRGFVVRSNVSGGDPGVPGAERGRASFALRIPAGQLSSALGGLSDLGHVVSRSDGTIDITRRFVSARNRIAALTEARDRLLRELSEALTITEQQSIRTRLRIVEAQLEAARRDLAEAQQRVHLVPVRVTITADAAADTGSGPWGIDDALDDAGRVLTVAAGAALVGGAALLPFALLVALTAGARREWARRQRDRALDTAS